MTPAAAPSTALGVNGVLLMAALLASCGWKSDGLERLEQLYPTRVPVVADAGPTTAIDLGTPMCSGYDNR